MPRRPTFRCPCCGYRTLTELGGYDICPVCFWENSETETSHGGPNPNMTSLAVAQENFQTVGACDAVSVRSVRPPRTEEGPPEPWTPDPGDPTAVFRAHFVDDDDTSPDI